MTYLELHTTIKAGIQETFNLSRNIDFHVDAASQTMEEAIGGRTSGEIGLGETVMWRGRHFGVYLTHTSLISHFAKPRYFVDEMIKGNFTFFKHYHLFKKQGDKTIMTDVLMYKVPFGIIGDLFNFFFLKRHLVKFLKHRNLTLKKTLEK